MPESDINLKKILDILKQSFFLKITNAVVRKVRGNSWEQLDQLIEKYFSYYKTFSINNLFTHLPELLGHALYVGFYLGQETKSIDYEISKWLENLKRELERRKYENYIR